MCIPDMARRCMQPAALKFSRSAGSAPDLSPMRMDLYSPLILLSSVVFRNRLMVKRIRSGMYLSLWASEGGERLWTSMIREGAPIQPVSHMPLLPKNSV